MNEFVHLHVHSEYSLLDGAARIEDLAETAARNGMKALALTDHGVMYGAIPFYKACVKRGIKPIIGCEVYLTTGPLKEKGARKDNPIYHLILLAKNEQGYRNLMKICSVAQLEGFHYKPRIDLEHLAAYAEGIVCLSACLGGEISRHLQHDRQEEALKAALRYRDMFGEDFYLELQDHGLIEQKKVNAAMIELSRETGIPMAVTNDIHYITEPDHKVQDVLLCIGTGKTVDDQERFKFSTDQLYFKNSEEMSKLFRHVPEAVVNTSRIADKCNLELTFGTSILPAFEPIPDGFDSESYLKTLCESGLEARFGKQQSWKDAEFRESVTGRLSYELNVIQTMGFSDYFLIVWDFIRYAHDNGIATGPGRGSSAGSLVAYVLRITDVDPIRYKLLFERFLNPERISMPDIDIDFSDERRDEVIDYVARKYGSDRVAQIITFGTMAAKAAVRDVGRVLNLPYHEVDRAAKMIPNMLGITIEKALELNPELKKLTETQPKTAELIQMARKVEGMPRHASTHAAGVIISRDPLTHYVPLQAGTEHSALTQYSMEHLESIGLLKMDFLGLRTLSIIERTLHWVKVQFGKDIDFHAIPDDDPRTYEMLSRGDTTGIFQLESAGMRRVLKDLKPSTFEDIVSVLALYRPGPMEFIPKYISGKHGQIQVEYPHPSLEPILSDTYGIIVYQEQIMQIASAMAGFSLGEADLLRRAVSKKKREVLDEQRAHFVQGSLKEGYPEDDANKVYDMIVRFADYGFPRAHAAAYGVLAFQTAYLKAHYPVQFMASMLTAVMGNHRKVAEYIDDCRRMGIDILPPDVNSSEVLFTPQARGTDRNAIGNAVERAAPTEPAVKEPLAEEVLIETVSPLGGIRFGLAAIKNVGTQAIETIIKERKESVYADLLDFCRKVDLRVCNKRVIESLIQGGAFDSMQGHRAQLIAMLDETLDAAVKWKKERDDLQLQLFGFVEAVNWTIEYPEIKPYSHLQQLELERELLGLFISGHPLDSYEDLLRKAETDRILELPELPDGREVWVAGMIVSQRNIVTKKGQSMAFLELEDRVDKLEAVLFPETWKRYGSLVHKGALVLVRAKLQHQDEDIKLLADELIPLDSPELPARLRAMKRPGASSPRAGAGARPAGQAAARAPGPAAPAAPPAEREQPTAPPAQSAPAAKRQSQKVFVRIAEDRETPAVLSRLKALLQRHAGPLQTVLFYEREGKLLALNEQHNVKPSPELFGGIAEILGPDAVRVK
ncbi:DNA polymerase III subunit alpha [Paenibacillus swuensis]|uniref:DNA polymerase III subunit alpha n=1 Tax=Paenibacillus swuensis TaxID=1178515 RepID=A0A172TN31_9BACL|nr:DNA polymerase III subunit alpha [Paenibacillus swuensis]ANE48448.1 DNA polymerase III subunit alpha [Paenibacillus swuensis]